MEPATAEDRNGGVEPKSDDTEKKRPTRTILTLAFLSLGAIYGDIGTSPLYTVSTILRDVTSPTPTDALRTTSAIFWSFTIVAIMKYAIIVLTIGPNSGEGGQIALYAKIARSL
ncbi:potassium transporter-domain-containing protein [Dipodascopsis uninucleata]